MKDVNKEIVFVGGQGNYQLFFKILKDLGELLGNRCSHEPILFDKHSEGEFNSRFEDYKKIQGKVVVFYQSMYSQELFDEALDLIWACKHQYGAKYIIGVFPFMWNRRQDPIMKEEDKIEKWSKKTARPHEIQRLRESIYFLKCAGIDEMLVVSPHSILMKKFCEDYEVKFNEIDVSVTFASRIQTFVPFEDYGLVKVYAPDAGSIPRAVNLARILHCPVLFNLKQRAINLKTTIVDEEKEEIEKLEKEFRTYYDYEKIFYNISSELVDKKVIIMVEDEVTSGGTSNDTGKLLKQYGAKSILLFVTHPVLASGWISRLFHDNPYSKIVMTDSIPRGYGKSTHGKIVDVSVSGMIASSLFKVLDRL